MTDDTNQCHQCEHGYMVVYCTRVDRAAGVRTRYRKCNQCGRRADAPDIIPLAMAPMQRSRAGTKHQAK